MAKKLLHCCIGAHARAHVHFLRRVCMHFYRCCEHHACAGVYVRQVLWTPSYTFPYMLAIGCAYALMYVQFLHSALGNEDGGVQIVYMRAHVAWRGVIFFWTEGKIGVLSMSSLFLTRVGVYVSVSVCICTHTHTLHIWGSRMLAQRFGWDI